MNGKITIFAVGMAVIAVMSTVLFSFAPVSVDDATDVIVLMGQSNADYREETANASEVSPVPVPGSAFYYGTEAMPADFKTDPTSCGVWPMSDTSGARIGDKWPTIAAAYHEATGHNVAMYQLAIEGISITAFDPNSLSGQAWQKCKPMTNSALDAFRNAGMTIGRVSVVWIQGEADYNSMTAEEYQERLLVVFSAILNGGIGANVDGPIWICKVRDGRAPVIADAQIEFCKQHPGIAQIATELADTFSYENGLRFDWSHYTQKGNNILGEAIGEALAEGQKEAAEKSDTLWILIGAGIMVCIAGIFIAVLSRR